MDEVIATRDLEFVHTNGRIEQVKVSIGKPVLEEDFWKCHYLIEAESFEKKFDAAGAESMQALILAIYIISAELEALAQKHNGTFTFFGESDLGFPLSNEKRSKY